ncbi:3-hydroxyacyl-CoA dehydrogenase [Micrococcus sp.]|uniref:3-hydroxyacyl-CoA dehydrogenase n=1 Tax=Micrococcus sp. TaxID=1271 RepID=UPI002A910BE6|nr:3-hydroxyacyl-CoA dehydrogenase [Micrococcus sp.]MDY6054986.1 3-hydroxyacyl-CoA dehydrogenase [Micrococcus sp.]
MTAFTTFEKVAVLGTGVLGSQIIMQAAYHGKEVYAYDAVEDALEALPQRWEWIRAGYKEDLGEGYDAQRFDEAIERIHPTSDLAEAVGDADIVIEAVPENLDLKKKVWAEIGEKAADKTLFATNTSSLLPSDFADASGHPEKFVTLHYANRVWSRNTAEVMGTDKSSQEAIDGALQYAEETGMVPVHVRKEVPGYLLNSLSIPWLSAAAALYVNGVANPEEIDRTWRIATGNDHGPFQAFDLVGFGVASNIHRNSGDPVQVKFADMLQESIDAGHSGVADGQGFYTYDSDGNQTGVVKDWELDEQ